MLYLSNLKNKEYFIKNPDNVLPKSVIVFVYKQKSETITSLDDSYNISGEILQQINTLKKRGRKINVIYSNEVFDVYEIINKPNESRINDLIFKI